MKHLFVYGTLLLGELFTRIVRREYASMRGYVDGYQRLKVIGEVYPALVPSGSGDHVHGIAYLNVSLKDLRRLDNFEGDMYHRISVKMHTELGEVLMVDTYLCESEYLHRVGENHWELGDFNAAARQKFYQLSGLENRLSVIRQSYHHNRIPW